MPRPLRYWNQYPVSHIDLAKNVAQSTLPVRHGPFTQKAAAAFRASFYRFREALRISPDRTPKSYPGRFYEMIESLAVEIEGSSTTTGYYVVFDLDEITKHMSIIDPASAQRRELAREQFLLSQKPPEVATPVSEPMFTKEEMAERKAEMAEKFGLAVNQSENRESGNGEPTKAEKIAFLKSCSTYDDIWSEARHQMDTGKIDDIVLRELYNKHKALAATATQQNIDSEPLT